MIIYNSITFLQVTIVLTIVPFTMELAVPKASGEKKYNSDQIERNVDNEPAAAEYDYYHRNDMGHLNGYYQERTKLREQYNAIQKSIQGRTFKNTTTPEDEPKRNFLDIRPAEKHIFQNVNLSDNNSLPPGLPDINQTSPAKGSNRNSTKKDSNSTALIIDSEIGFHNKTYVKLGNCEGFVFYRQNIYITGANQDVMNGYSVDVNLEGICIACIEIFSKNSGEVKVKVTSGGPGKENTSLKFEGFDRNINLLYALRIWGVGRDC